MVVFCGISREREISRVHHLYHTCTSGGPIDWELKHTEVIVLNHMYAGLPPDLFDTNTELALIVPMYRHEPSTEPRYTTVLYNTTMHT